MYITSLCIHLCVFSAEREVVLSNLDTLCSVALGEKVAEDYLLARDTLITITNITDHVRVCMHILDFYAPQCCINLIKNGVILKLMLVIPVIEKLNYSNNVFVT